METHLENETDPVQLTLRRRQIRNQVVNLALHDGKYSESSRTTLIAILTTYDAELERRQTGSNGSSDG